MCTETLFKEAFLFFSPVFLFLILVNRGNVLFKVALVGKCLAALVTIEWSHLQVNSSNVIF